MNFGYILRFATISLAVGVATVVGCGGASPNDLLTGGGPPGSGDDGSTGGGDSGNNPPPERDSGRDSGQGSDTGADVGPPEDDSGVPDGVRCDDGNSDPPSRICTAGTPICCIASGVVIGGRYDCISTNASCSRSDSVRVACDSDADCSNGRRCCGHQSDQDKSFDQVTCDDVNHCDQGRLHLCHSTEDCGGNGQCTGVDSVNKAYHYCQ